MDRSPSGPGTSVTTTETAASPTPTPGTSPHPRLLPRLLDLRFRGVPVLTLFLLGAAVSIVVGNYLPTRAKTAATERALDDTRRENRALAERIRQGEAEAQRLETDPWAHERILRDQLHMSKQGEVIVR